MDGILIACPHAWSTSSCRTCWNSDTTSRPGVSQHDALTRQVPFYIRFITTSVLLQCYTFLERDAVAERTVYVIVTSVSHSLWLKILYH